MLEELGQLILRIQEEYNKLADSWKADSNYKSYNLSRKLVKQFETLELYNYAIEYRSFLNSNILNFALSIKDWNINNSKVSARIKLQNSIMYKIENYKTQKHQNGEVPVNKCLNDLFGIRIILDGNYTHDDIAKYIDKNFKGLKCICSDKQEYVATHIYFKKTNDNTVFQWELQVWLNKNEHSNKESHSKYKQDYVKWENQIKKEEA